MPGLLLVATGLLVAWGALAFGAVYPWAWRPLITGCAVVGAASWLVARRSGAQADDRALLVALACLALASVLQLVPLPRDVRLALSPANETLLLEQDLEYALAARMTGMADDGVTAQVPAALPDRALSINTDATARAVVLLGGLTLLLAGLTRLLNVTGVRGLAAGIVGFGVLLALIGIVQKAVLGDHAALGMKIYGFWAPRNILTTPFGPFVNRNHFAGWMLMGVPLALGMALGYANRASRVLGGRWRDAVLWLSSPDGGKLQMAGMALVIMGVALAMTRSRSGVAGFVLAMMVTGIVVGRRFGGRSRVMAIGGLVVVLATVFAWAGMSMKAGRGADPSIELRRAIWTDSARVIRDFPLVGTGLNTFGTAMLSYQSRQRSTHFQEAHNDYLQVVVEGGALLAVPAFAGLALLVAGIVRRFRARQDDTLTYWLRVGATTGLVAIGLQSLVEFSLQMPGNAVLAVVLMAVALHRPPARVARGPSTSREPRSLQT